MVPKKGVAVLLPPTTASVVALLLLVSLPTTTASPSYRTLEKCVPGAPTTDGAGVKLTRILGQRVLESLDPFLMLDELKADYSSQTGMGFPDHPHRGFETVTYMLSGRAEHEDSRGNHGILTAGSVQWMTAGRGIVHSEMLAFDESRTLHGFQLWINLPAKDKMCEPRYQDIPASDIPVLESDDGTRVKVVAGNYEGVEGAVKGIATAPVFLDVHLAPLTTFTHVLPPAHTAFSYVYNGTAAFGPDPVTATRCGTREAQVWTLGESLSVHAGDKGARFLLMAAAPIREPIAKRGPFVMNTKTELEAAFVDYREGRLGRD